MSLEWHCSYKSIFVSPWLKCTVANKLSLVQSLTLGEPRLPPPQLALMDAHLSFCIARIQSGDRRRTQYLFRCYRRQRALSAIFSLFSCRSLCAHVQASVSIVPPGVPFFLELDEDAMVARKPISPFSCRPPPRSNPCHG